jgi:hypothetical protein
MHFWKVTRVGLVNCTLLPALGCSGSESNCGSNACGGHASGGASGGANASGGTTSSGGNASPGGTTSSGGAAAGSGSGAAPASASLADISAFLESGGYKKDPWISDVATPRKGSTGTQHGDGIRVWQNPTLVAAMRGGHDGRMGNPKPDVGSMAVKEMYDASNQLIGLAAALRTADTNSWDSWTYFCYAPGGRCTSGDVDKSAPLYGNGNATKTQPCVICHDGTIFTKIP